MQLGNACLSAIENSHISIDSPLAARSRCSIDLPLRVSAAKSTRRRKTYPSLDDQVTVLYHGAQRRRNTVQESFSYLQWRSKVQPANTSPIHEISHALSTLSLQANLKFQAAALTLAATKFSPLPPSTLFYQDGIGQEQDSRPGQEVSLFLAHDVGHGTKTRRMSYLEDVHKSTNVFNQTERSTTTRIRQRKISMSSDPFRSRMSEIQTSTDFERKLREVSGRSQPYVDHPPTKFRWTNKLKSDMSRHEASPLRVTLEKSSWPRSARVPSSKRSESQPRDSEYSKNTSLRQRSPVKRDAAAAIAGQASSAFAQTNYALSGFKNSWDDKYLNIREGKDEAYQFARCEVWLQRLIWGLFVFGANASLVAAFFLANRHQYLFAILLFIKSKDLLSTIACFTAIFYKSTHKAIWTPRHSKPLWIMTVVTAYAETEEQILKTVMSLINQKCAPHRQAICIVLDGKPRDILSHFSTVTYQKRRPYTTWRCVRMEVQIHAGRIAGTPIILLQKLRNAGKKDSLIFCHDLFNVLRESAPTTTKILREEIMTCIIPTLFPGVILESFDTIFCTDADSVVHEDALRHLANALSQDRSAIAACGMLLAELTDDKHEWGVWHLFQQFQYTFGQYVRRQAEGTWGRVTCLPGVVTMIAVRPEMAAAVDEYARPITDHNLVRHQVQYLGTDRRLTWCMLSQYKHLRSLFIPEAMSETVVPTTLSHYLSQRRRWASNAYFNDFFYAFGRQQRLITRFFSVVEVLRLTLVFYRVFNTGLFIHSLATRWHVLKIVATLVVTKTPVMWYLVVVVFTNPVLRKRAHKLLLGMCINQVISPFLSIVVFANVVLSLGTQVWGRTGVSSRTTSTPQRGPPPLPQSSTPKFTGSWTPTTLAKTVRAAVQKQCKRQGLQTELKKGVPSDKGSQPPGKGPHIPSSSGTFNLKHE